MLQVRTFYTQVLNEEERQRLCQNFAGSLKGAQLFIQKRMVSSHTIITPGIYTIFPFLSGALRTCYCFRVIDQIHIMIFSIMHKTFPVVH